MLPFQEAVIDDLEKVNQHILFQLHSDVELVESIGHHLIDAGGKRLRPILVLLTANSLNIKSARHIELATVIEFIHTATLLHDDVVDTSDLRRGRPTANAQFGNAPSVLVGDFLYSRAFQMLVHLGDMRIMQILSDTTNVISEGEVQQLVNAKNPDLTEQAYKSVIHKKTAALFEAACETAAVLAGANLEVQKSALHYGKNLGLAFQLIDDLLDYESDAETMGKNVGDDLAEGKVTLPLIYAMQHCQPQDKDILRNAILQGDLTKLDEVVNLVKQSGALEHTRKQAAQHAEMAKAALAEMPDSHYKTAMLNLADFAVLRQY